MLVILLKAFDSFDYERHLVKDIPEARRPH
jgi:hypothetical protein